MYFFTLHVQNLNFYHDFKPGYFYAGFKMFTQGQISSKYRTWILHLGAFNALSRVLRRIWGILWATCWVIQKIYCHQCLYLEWHTWRERPPITFSWSLEPNREQDFICIFMKSMKISSKSDTLPSLSRVLKEWTLTKNNVLERLGSGSCKAKNI